MTERKDRPDSKAKTRAADNPLLRSAQIRFVSTCQMCVKDTVSRHIPADCVFAAKLRQQHRGVLRCLQCIGRSAKANGAQSRYGERRALKIWQDPAEVRSLALASLVEASINKPSSIAKLVSGLNTRMTPRSPADSPAVAVAQSKKMDD